VIVNLAKLQDILNSLKLLVWVFLLDFKEQLKDNLSSLIDGA